MTEQEERKEGEILIAEFMKVKYITLIKGGSVATPKISEVKTYLADGWNFYSPYYKLWDRIMPVVEEIESMGFGVKQCRKVVDIYVDSTKVSLLLYKKSNRIESLWYAIVHFIKWHNTHKSNS